MNLSKFTDYSFRILIYIGNNPDKNYTVNELSHALNLSSHHIKKIVYKLVKHGYLSSFKGRNGGIRLSKAPNDINLAKLLEITEDNLNIVECFSKESNSCDISSCCKLKPVIALALKDFKLRFSEYTLEDMLD